MTVDPLLSLLVGALGAAVLGIGGGLFGAWIQSRREHKRWIREQRLSAYLTFIVAAEQPSGRPSLERHASFVDSAKAAMASVFLLGPDSVSRGCSGTRGSFDGLGASCCSLV